MEDLKFDEIRNQITGLAEKLPVEFFDVRVVSSKGTAIELVKGITREVSTSMIQGVGIRVFQDAGWGFSATNVLDPNHLESTFRTAWKLAKATGRNTREKFTLKERDPRTASKQVPVKKPIDEYGIEEKIELLQDQDQIARASNEIANAQFVYFDGMSEAQYFDILGSSIFVKGSAVRLGAAVFAQREGLVQKGSKVIAGRGGMEILDDHDFQSLGQHCAGEAIALLDSKPSPGGKFTLIMDPKLCGTFIHEAFGHPCEADAVLSKTSILEGRIGEQVGVESVHIVDDATLPTSYGFYYFDAEGTPGQRTVLVEDGILKGFLHSLETASRLGVPPTGNGRAQSYDYSPQVRMSSTYLEAGDMSFEELVEDIDHGIYAQDWLYGYTNPANGSFMFKVKKAQLIENGEIKEQLFRDTAMSGMTLEVLNHITGLGKELGFSPGTCGKGGQGVPVGDGGVHTRVENIIIGGRE